MSDRWAGTRWRIVAVGDLTLSGGATLSFDDQHRVSGTGGVNRFSGTYTSTGVVLSVGALAVTRMMGPEEIMAEEQAVLAALSEPLTLVDNPVLEPADLTPAEERLESEGGLVLDDTLVLEGLTTLRLAPLR
jgi:heat shock protein HslJ